MLIVVCSGNTAVIQGSLEFYHKSEFLVPSNTIVSIIKLPFPLPFTSPNIKSREKGQINRPSQTSFPSLIARLKNLRRTLKKKITLRNEKNKKIQTCRNNLEGEEEEGRRLIGIRRVDRIKNSLSPRRGKKRNEGGDEHDRLLGRVTKKKGDVGEERKEGKKERRRRRGGSRTKVWKTGPFCVLRALEG